jgi:tetratricopeptide (TPR) repeat protein
MLLALLLPLALPAQDAPSSPVELVDEARAFIPVYEGDHKAFLTKEEERNTLAAAHILEASLALDPVNAAALWWLGHCEVLLGENLRNRGAEPGALAHYESALGAYARSLVVDPSSYWAHYARGMAERNVDRLWDAIGDYDQAVERADLLIGQGAGVAGYDDARFVRFKARQWRADTRMRTLENETARVEYRAFYADNGDNQWDLGYSLAQTYMQERDYTGARETYEHILTFAEFATFDSTYYELAYLAGLRGERELAASLIEQGLEHELQLSLYPRLWLWILAPDEGRAAAEADLADFLEHPPGSVTAWDLQLGRYLLGDGADEQFLEAARTERERRMQAAEDLGDLMCEVWFYVGLRRELRATEEDAVRIKSAVEAHRNALAFRPRQHKWEWEYARAYFARLALELDLKASAGFSIDGTRIQVGELAGEVERVLWHRAGTERRVEGIAALVQPLEPGDLVQAVVRRDDDSRVVVQLVADIFSW